MEFEGHFETKPKSVTLNVKAIKIDETEALKPGDAAKLLISSNKKITLKIVRDGVPFMALISFHAIHDIDIDYPGAKQLLFDLISLPVFRSGSIGKTKHGHKHTSWKKSPSPDFTLSSAATSGRRWIVSLKGGSDKAIRDALSSCARVKLLLDGGELPPDVEHKDLLDPNVVGLEEKYHKMSDPKARLTPIQEDPVRAWLAVRHLRDGTAPSFKVKCFCYDFEIDVDAVDKTFDHYVCTGWYERLQEDKKRKEEEEEAAEEEQKQQLEAVHHHRHHHHHNQHRRHHHHHHQHHHHNHHHHHHSLLPLPPSPSKSPPPSPPPPPPPHT
jgi:hypothetical protein